MNSVHRTLKPGMSFIEIIAVVAIMAILATAAMMFVGPKIERSRRDTTMGSLQTLKTCITSFHLDTGAYPDQLEDLVERPIDERIAARWVQYIENALPRDGWGNDFEYQKTPGAAHPYELYSHGTHGDEAPEEEYLSVWSV